MSARGSQVKPAESVSGSCRRILLGANAAHRFAGRQRALEIDGTRSGLAATGHLCRSRRHAWTLTMAGEEDPCSAHTSLADMLRSEIVPSKPRPHRHREDEQGPTPRQADRADGPSLRACRRHSHVAGIGGFGLGPGVAVLTNLFGYAAAPSMRGASGK